MQATSAPPTPGDRVRMTPAPGWQVKARKAAPASEPVAPAASDERLGTPLRAMPASEPGIRTPMPPRLSQGMMPRPMQRPVPRRDGRWLIAAAMLVIVVSVGLAASSLGLGGRWVPDLAALSLWPKAGAELPPLEQQPNTLPAPAPSLPAQADPAPAQAQAQMPPVQAMAALPGGEPAPVARSPESLNAEAALRALVQLSQLELARQAPPAPPPAPPLTTLEPAAAPAMPGSNPAATAPVTRGLAVAPPVASTRYQIQLAALSDADQARRAWDQLSDAAGPVLAGMQPSFEQASTKNGIFYRVQVGDFGSSGEADATCNELRALQLSCFVIHR